MRPTPAIDPVQKGQGRSGLAKPAARSWRKLKLDGERGEDARSAKSPEGERSTSWDYTFGRMYSARTGQARIGYRPSKKSIQRAVEKVHALTDRSGTWQETTTLVGKVNRTLLRVGELLLGRHRQQGVSGARCLRGDAVAPVGCASDAQRQAEDMEHLRNLLTGTSRLGR